MSSQRLSKKLRDSRKSSKRWFQHSTWKFLSYMKMQSNLNILTRTLIWMKWSDSLMTRWQFSKSSRKLELNTMNGRSTSTLLQQTLITSMIFVRRLLLGIYSGIHSLNGKDSKMSMRRLSLLKSTTKKSQKRQITMRK
jgi:hypothetical protein